VKVDLFTITPPIDPIPHHVFRKAFFRFDALQWIGKLLKILRIYCSTRDREKQVEWDIPAWLRHMNGKKNTSGNMQIVYVNRGSFKARPQRGNVRKTHGWLPHRHRSCMNGWQRRSLTHRSADYKGISPPKATCPNSQQDKAQRMKLLQYRSKVNSS